MMSSENIPPAAHPSDHHHTNGGVARKSSAQKTLEPPQQAPLKCPRCDSSNTKFCYYNNYSLTQPRHFCKTCRRYWTKGGALRNVPIGGGCRKAKKHRPTSSSSSCPTSSSSRLDLSGGPGGVAEFKFLAPPTVTPAMEFQLGGLSLPRLHPATAGVYTQFIASSGSQAQAQHYPVGLGPGNGGCLGLDLLGLGNYPTVPTSGNSTSSSSSSLSLAGGGGGGGGDHNISISSIESLSSINQEMHWKLQQQRLAFIYGPTSIDQDDNNNHQNQEKPIIGGGGINLFNLENTRKIDNQANNPTEWLFEQIPLNYNSSSDNHNNTSSVAVTATTTTTSCHNNNNLQDFNGLWTTQLHHQHQFHGLQ